MRAVAILAAAAAFSLLVGGCGPGGSDPAAGGVSAKEAQALNDAAAALDDNGADAVIVDNGAGPAVNGQ